MRIKDIFNMRRDSPGPVEPSSKQVDEMTTSTTTIVLPALTGHESCDRCCAPAKVQVLLRSGGELLFCGHHAREHGPRLRDDGALLNLAV
jgi:hypothetical protein